MQKVSKAYRLSMQAPLRERGYIMISFGLLSQEAQRKATVGAGDFTYFSNTANIFDDEASPITYATLEENLTPVDGSMLFLPRQSDVGLYLDSGIVSENLVSQEIFEVVLDMNIKPIDFKGMTLEFGENYPVDFDIVINTGQILEIRNNEMATFVTEEVFSDATQVRLVFYRMRNPQSRVRIYYIMFGYGLLYKNPDVLDSSLDSFVSPICEELPTVDFEVTLKNYNRYFNVSNPNSAIHFFETGQKMEISYGYELPGTGQIEWITGNTLYCSDWEADDSSVIIRGYDVYRTMDGEYYKGVYSPEGVSYYDLAVTVLQDAGIEDYYIDPRLKNLYTHNPLPRVSHKQALQIIANASRCVLTQSRTGEIEMRSAFVPDAVASAQTEAVYSHAENLLNGKEKAEYASLNTNYTVADGTMFFIPRDLNLATLNTGFVSQELSDANCVFPNNPLITIQLEAAFMYYGVNLWFGHAIPAEFIIRTYKENVLVTERRVESDEIDDLTTINDRFDEFDTMTIEFVKTAYPYNRIVLNNFSFGSVSDLTITRDDMIEGPHAIKQELVKDVVVWCYNYQRNEEEETLYMEEVTVTSGEERIYYTDTPYYGFRATLDEESAGTVVESGSYYVKVRFDAAGTFDFTLYGHPYVIMEQRVVRNLNARGKTIEWANPLMSDVHMAENLSEWLGDHYISEVEYRYGSRGNPELDTGDIIYQLDDFSSTERIQVKVYRQSMTFNGSFGGAIEARRMGGQNGLDNT